MENSFQPPPAKRRFFIEDLLQDQTGRGVSPQPEKPSHYVEKLHSEIEYNEKFHCLQCHAKFLINDIPADPEALLSGIFLHCIDEAVALSRGKDIDPNYLGLTISSELLDRGDIWIPVRPLSANIVDTVMNRFLRVVQSKSQEGVTLWGKPFTVSVVAIDPSKLAQKRNTVGGARRKIAPVNHLIRPHSLINVDDPDGSKHCLFYALHATLTRNISGLDRKQFYDYLKGRGGQRGKFREETLHLMEMVDAPRGLPEYSAEEWVPRIVDVWNREHGPRSVFCVFIFGELGHYRPIFKYGPQNYNTPILLYHHNNHFDGVKKSSNLFGKPYCLACESCYENEIRHKKTCRHRCIWCARVGPTFPCKTVDNYKRECDGCQKLFTTGDQCFNHHLGTVCRKSKFCKQCGIIWDVEANTRKGRKETMQHERRHQTNFVSAKVMCPNCIETGEWKNSLQSGSHKCSICGDHRSAAFSQRAFRKTPVDHKVVSHNPLAAFVDWLLFDLPNGHDRVVFSHFGGRFDMVIVFRELFERGFNPEMIRKGNKLFEMKIQKKNGRKVNTISFRDSFNLMPMSLASMVSSFGLEVEDKGDFPHLANRPENYGITMACLPPQKSYMVNSMMPEKRKKFIDWWTKNRTKPFLLDEELASYGMNDVDILSSALVAFRTEFLAISKREGEHDGIDALREPLTIASACMRHFRLNHLKKDYLGITPEKGYDNASNQSLLAHRFMEWLAEEEGVQIQTSHSEGGEKRIGPYLLDGWIEAEQRAVEVHGCVWHACKQCFPDDMQMLPSGKTAGKVREMDKNRLEFIRSKVARVDVYWECEITKMLGKNKDMRAKFDAYRDKGPLVIRSGFFGGRTAAYKLYHKPKRGERISYFDVTSLYPYTNYITRYPIGHPKVHVLNAKVDWKCPEDNPYPLSLLKVLVVPPRDNRVVPVLPLHQGDRLVFAKCFKCCQQFPEGAVRESYSCSHTDEERSWVSTCTSLELNRALAEGYRVTQVYRVLKFTESSDEVFRPYIREFMAEKIHASDFDPKIKGDQEAEAKFISECLELFGIKIDPKKMNLNKGKRMLAKLMLNNLWGRFALRNFGLSQTVVTDDPATLAQYLRDQSLEISSIDSLNERAVLISYMRRKEWIEEHDCSNLNSLIYSHPESHNPLQTGEHLGQLTDEYPEHEILEFCSGGAKQYGLKLRKMGEDKFEYVLKVRGMTLNYDVLHNQGLRYDTFKERVLKYARTGEAEPISVIYPNFLRPSISSGHVITQSLTKIYRPIVTKGVVDTNTFKVLDFGHI